MDNKFKNVFSRFLQSQTKNKVYQKFLIFTVLFYSVLVVIPSLKYFPITGVGSYWLLAGNWLFFTLLSGIIIFLLSINRWVFTFLVPVYILSTGGVSFYISRYNVTINSAVIESTLYTNSFEAISQISFFLLGYVFLLIAFSALVIFLRFKIKELKVSWQNFAIVFVAVVLVFVVNTGRARTTFQYSPFSLFAGLVDWMHTDYSLSPVRKDIDQGAVCNSDTLTVVFVVGEAMRADHVSLNGYYRPTFPLMAEENPVSFKNIHSEWSYTIKSLPHIFTRADSVNHLPASTEKTFISIFDACNYKSWWIGNQDLNKFLTPIADDCDSVRFYSYSKDFKRYDGKMLPEIKKAVNSSAPRKLIVVHQFGCHWWYPANCPPEFEKFKPVLTTKNITRSDSANIVNSYDNVILYTDYFLSQIVDMLKDKNAILIFLADHGELLGEEDKWIHAQQTKYEENPACVLWFSGKYSSEFPGKVEAAEINKDKHFRTDFMFHTALDAGNIKSPYYTSSLSLLEKH